YILNNDPLLIRLYSSGGLTTSQMLEAQKHGIGNNGLYTSCAPIFFIGFSIRNLFNPKLKFILVFSIIAILVSILLSTFLTSIALLVFIGLALLLLNINLLKNFKVFFSVTVILILSYFIISLL